MRLGGFLILSAALAACSGPYSEPAVSAKTEAPPLEVETVRVETELIPEVVSAAGELFAEEEATIGAKAPGRVERLLVDLGSVVEAGDVLAEIEKAEYEFRLRQAEALVNQTRARLGILDREDDDVVPEETAMVRRAAAGLKEAKFVYDTSKTLAEEGVLSRIDFEKAGVARQAAEAAYQGALEEVMQLRAQLSERRAVVDLARQNLDDCVIRAPFDGAVTDRVASVGEFLPVNGPAVTLVRRHPIRIRLEIPERSAGKIRVGQSVAVRLEGSLAPQASGRVVRLSPAIDPSSRALIVEGEIPNERGLLRPGSFAEGLITVDTEARGLAAPRDAVLTFAGVERVFVVAEGVLEDRVVKTGRLLDGDRVEILDGVEAGSRLVREASDRMRAGQAVAARASHAETR